MIGSDEGIVWEQETEGIAKHNFVHGPLITRLAGPVSSGLVRTESTSAIRDTCFVRTLSNARSPANLVLPKASLTATCFQTEKSLATPLVSLLFVKIVWQAYLTAKNVISNHSAMWNLKVIEHSQYLVFGFEELVRGILSN